MIGHAPKIKMMKGHGPHLRLDDEAERKLLEGAQARTWRRRTFELFRDIVILMRDTGMRNQRELYRMRIENLDWENRRDFRPRQQDRRGATTCSDESSRRRDFACTVRYEERELGVPIQACRYRASAFNRSPI